MTLDISRRVSQMWTICPWKWPSATSGVLPTNCVDFASKTRPKRTLIFGQNKLIATWIQQRVSSRPSPPGAVLRNPALAQPGSGAAGAVRHRRQRHQCLLKSTSHLKIPHHPTYITDWERFVSIELIEMNILQTTRFQSSTHALTASTASYPAPATYFTMQSHLVCGNIVYDDVTIGDDVTTLMTSIALIILINTDITWVLLMFVREGRTSKCRLGWIKPLLKRPLTHSFGLPCCSLAGRRFTGLRSTDSRFTTTGAQRGAINVWAYRKTLNNVENVENIEKRCKTGLILTRRA